MVNISPATYPTFLEADDSGAEEMAGRASAIQPNNGADVDTPGGILVKKEAVQGGVAMLRRAPELDDDRLEIRYQLAAALVAAGETEEAKPMTLEIPATEVRLANRQKAADLPPT